MGINTVRKKAGRAIGDYDMIRDGDRVMVALSGGKDSYCLLDVLHELRRRAPIKYTLVPVLVDAGFPGFSAAAIAAFAAKRGYRLHIVSTNIYKSVLNMNTAAISPCAVCSRFRRGVLYRLARDQKCSRLALGHHADDIIETLMMNLCFNGSLKAMAPVWRAEDGYNTVIRPLCNVWEKEIEAYLAARNLVCNPFVCPLGGDKKEATRQQVKQLLAAGNEKFPGLKQNLLSAAANLKPEYLMDRKFFQLP